MTPEVRLFVAIRAVSTACWCCTAPVNLDSAFFISFFVWFNHAPLMAAIRETFGLSKEQVAALLIMNVALTIPARVAVGILVDKFGPRLMYTILLAVSGVICIGFAFAPSYDVLAIMRFLLAFVGAGFVIGIRIISDWFPAKETGYAQGIYAGLGNFGSAAAAVTLPSLALAFGGPDGWRKDLQVWESVGATHVAVGTRGAALGSVSAHIDALRKVKEELA